jgi:ABC-type nitrate/sulfonate/bicarbonate transport system substrate-binding protein
MLLKTLIGVGIAFAATLGSSSFAADKVRVGMSAFQDVSSLYVGIEKGFFPDIEFDIQKTDWPGANELLIGGHVDIATSSDSDVILQNSKGIPTTFSFPLFYFAGGGLMYDPKAHAEWKPLKDFLASNGNDMKAAIASTLSQAKGLKVGVSAGGGEYASFIEMVTIAGLKPSDFTIVDLAQEELPPALLSGSIDIMIAGIPQRLAVLREGYATLMDQSSVPSTVSHAGFASTREFVDKNPDLAARIEAGIMKGLKYIEENPDDAFPIISEKMKEAGTTVSVEDLKGVWNSMEFFPNSPAWYDQKVVAPDGQFYWKARFETVIRNLKAEGRVTDLDVPLEDLNYGLKTVEGAKKHW